MDSSAYDRNGGHEFLYCVWIVWSEIVKLWGKNIIIIKNGVAANTFSYTFEKGGELLARGQENMGLLPTQWFLISCINENGTRVRTMHDIYI